MDSFFLIGGNCPRRKLDAQTLYDYFISNNLIYKNVEEADIIVVYSCGGFNSSEKMSLDTINEMVKNKKKDALVIVTGCLTKINPASISGNVSIIPHDNLSKLDTIIDARVKFSSFPDSNLIGCFPDLLNDEKMKKKFFDYFEFHPRFVKKGLRYIKKRFTGKLRGGEPIFGKDIFNIMISRGCLGNCSYCAIKYSMGNVKSISENIILKEFKKGLSLGYKKFVLIGEDIGCYGIDIGTSIVSLLEKIFSVDGNYKLILNDFNPQWVIKYSKSLIPLLKKNKKRIIDIRMPIQSGSDKILQKMRRPYKISEVEDVLEQLKDFKVFTHIMVGFPSETEEDFNQTLEFVKKWKFGNIGVYAYQDRFITDSFKFDGKISEEEKEKRVRKIRRS